MPKAKKHAVIDAAKLIAQREHYPGTSRDARRYSAARLPLAFQTVIDPQTHPPQPWGDLPAPTGASPFRLGLDAILSSDAIQRIATSGRMVFHAVGDTGGVNTQRISSK